MTARQTRPFLQQMESLRSHELFYEPVLAFTFDTDLCPQFAVDAVAATLDEYDAPGTFFCDQAYAIPDGHQAGIHPHTGSHCDWDDGKAIDKALTFSPNATGCRFHQLLTKGANNQLLRDKGITYDSSYLALLQPEIRPILHPTRLIQYPVYFMEGPWFRYGIAPGLDNLLTPGLKIIGFHPVSLWHNLNGATFQSLRDVPFSERYREELITTEYGADNLFQDILRMAREHGLRIESLETITRILGQYR